MVNMNALAPRQSAATAPYDWILAITFIAYIFSAFGNGANDVANAYGKFYERNHPRPEPGGALIAAIHIPSYASLHSFELD